MRRLPLLIGICTVVFGVGCRSEHNLTPEHTNQAQQVFEAGLSLDGAQERVKAPRIQAETLRTLSKVDAKRFEDDLAEAATADDPTVRVAAVRALFASDHPKAEGLARRALAQSNGETVRAILHAVFDYDDPESGPAPAEAIAADYMWQALGPDYAPKVRRLAFQRGVEPLIRQKLKSDETQVRDSLLPKLDSTLLGRLDTAVGGDALRLMAELGEEDRAEPLIQLVTDKSASTKRRVQAARILRDARIEGAASAFQTIVDRAEFAPDLDRLALPESPIPDDLLKAATLGLVALGNAQHIDRAKDYMTRAGEARFVDVLEALSHNPANEARIALKNALQDARPLVRHRAIELWAEREKTDPDPLLNLIQYASFDQKERQTRYIAAEMLAVHYPEEWRTQMQRQLTSDEGISPALDMLVHLRATPRVDVTKTLESVKEPLVEIATSEIPKKEPIRTSNAGRAARLLVPLADSEELVSIVKASPAPSARYAYLESLISGEPTAHTAYILDNFYGKHPGPDLFGVRMMAAAALWKATE